MPGPLQVLRREEVRRGGFEEDIGDERGVERCESEKSGKSKV